MPTTHPKEVKRSIQAHEFIKREILECTLEPGQFLQEAALCERYQVGRTPFREACQRLEAEGLIEIVPHRGAFVTSLSAWDVNDLFELRLLIEPSIAELACLRKASGADLKKLDINLADSKLLLKGKRARAIPELNWNSQDFHVGIARLTHNNELVALVERMHNKLMRILVFTARRSPDDYPLNLIHTEIFDAIVRGDSREARRAMTRDIEEAKQWVQDFGLKS